MGDRTYRRLFVAQVVALFGTGLTTVALGLLAYDLAGVGAGAVLGGILAVKMVANVVVAPVAAALADRLPRRTLLVGLDLVRCAVVLVLPWVTRCGRSSRQRCDRELGAVALGVAYSAVLTPVGRVIRASAAPSGLPALFAAQYALSHAEWLVTYLLAGLLGSVLSPAATLACLAAVAIGGLVFAIRTWRHGDEVEHTHANLPEDDPHLADATQATDGWRHNHRYLIDRAHRHWPTAGQAS
ncbi:MFS family permease [Actinokineospora baliensis]|uniref:MFS transporter n=1 Tax=Actinokineospora baliensis TaxID=547056 RepID=UPI001EF8351C|nr:MFS transporter [Actinokineospora baliensis]MBM7774750.1 MFS family permease [Actinokineospora baliensis]